MIIELIGPGAIGKTTIEPFLAERLRITHYPGSKRHGYAGEALTRSRIWRSRLWSGAREPLLVVTAFRAHTGDGKERIRFALDISRRNRFAARAARSGDGVLSSGPTHALCAASANIGHDLTFLAPRIVTPDIFVRLHVEPDELTRRMAGRRGVPEEHLHDRAEINKQYDAFADHLLANMDLPVVEVEAAEAPEIVAEMAAVAVRQLIDPDEATASEVSN